MSWDAIGTIASVVGTILAMIVAYPAFRQLKDSANISKGEFILNLQQVYTDNTAYADLFMKCWSNYLDKESDEELLEYLKNNSKDVLNYLTFFESIYLMTDRKVLDMDLLDELFGRRFFIVVNNEVVQQFDLVKNCDYYENIFSLYRKWKSYRIKNNNKEFFIEKENGYKDLLVAVEEATR